jgi:hypothetical protein
MTDWPKVHEQLAEANKALKAAIDALAKGDVKTGLAEVAKAMEAKHLAINNMPDVELEPSFDLPFENIYDLFYDIDSILEDAKWPFIFWVYRATELKESRERLIASLRLLVQELKRSLLDKFKDADSDGAKLTRRLIKAIEEIIEDIRTRKPGGQPDDPSFDIFKKPAELKVEFLRALAPAANLDQAYPYLYRIDRALAWSYSYGSGWTEPYPEYVAPTIKKVLEAAEADKKALELVLPN